VTEVGRARDAAGREGIQAAVVAVGLDLDLVQPCIDLVVVLLDVGLHGDDGGVELPDLAHDVAEVLLDVEAPGDTRDVRGRPWSGRRWRLMYMLPILVRRAGGALALPVGARLDARCLLHTRAGMYAGLGDGLAPRFVVLVRLEIVLDLRRVVFERTILAVVVVVR